MPPRTAKSMLTQPEHNVLTVHLLCLSCACLCLSLQGKALNEVASKNCKVMVVGNPCNTNALIAMENAPNIPRKNFHALTRLDENRAKCQLALKSGKFYTNISRVCIWGNHSTTQVPDFINARIGGRPAIDVIQVGHRTSVQQAQLCGWCLDACVGQGLCIGQPILNCYRPSQNSCGCLHHSIHVLTCVCCVPHSVILLCVPAGHEVVQGGVHPHSCSAWWCPDQEVGTQQCRQHSSVHC